ncbi:Peroxisomal membrane protein pex16 [Ascosphaera pollenicola]|nr:Peroxisomal membrane protein pex16 [Ascosphaera pollenicola]
MCALDELAVNIGALQSLHQKLQKQADENDKLNRDIAALSSKNRELQRQVEGLQGQLRQQSDVGDSYISTVMRRCDSLHPSQVFARQEVNPAEAYQALYASFKSTIEGLRKTRQSLKFYQERERVMNHCLDQDQLRISRNHRIVYFQQIDEKTFSRNAAGSHGSQCLAPDASIQRQKESIAATTEDFSKSDPNQSQVSTLVNEEPQTQSSSPLINRDQAQPLGSHEHVASTQRAGSNKPASASSLQPKSSFTAAKKRKSEHPGESSLNEPLDFDDSLEKKPIPTESRLQDVLGAIRIPAFNLQLKQSGRLQNQQESDHVNNIKAGDASHPAAEESCHAIQSGVRDSPHSQLTATLDSSQEHEQAPVNCAAPRLRDCPLQALRTNHFQVNPDRNDGLDFAFSRVIRNKAMRQCLESCRRPDCCGRYFRSMGAMKPIDEANLTFKVLDQFDREALFREIKPEAGEELAELFDNMAIPARKEILLKARASLYADQFARHRFDYAPAPSPPGFWDVDMPSTPAVLRRKETAGHTEEEKVKQMYAEALRPFGRWKFIDE